MKTRDQVREELLERISLGIQAGMCLEAFEEFVDEEWESENEVEAMEIQRELAEQYEQY